MPLVMRRYLRHMAFCLLALALSSCLTSNSGPSVQPTTAASFLKINGIDEPAVVQQDTLHISRTRLVFGDLRISYLTSPPIKILEGQAGISFAAADKGDSVKIASREIPGQTYHSAGFSIALPGDIDVAHPEFSIFVTGTYNGDSLEFGTDTTFTFDVNLNSPLKVPSQNARVSLTIVSNAVEWFKDSSGAIINPNTASGQRMIEGNITSSFDFEVSLSGM